MLRRLLAAIVLAASMACAAVAQQGNTTTINFNGAPTGGCIYLMFAVDRTTGNLYDCFNGTWNLVTGGGGGGGPIPFSSILTGTNLSATMTVGNGATLTFSGTGVNNASKIQGVAITGTPNVGQIPIASSGTAAAWGDPLVTPNFADNSAFTAGTTGVMNIGAWYSASPTACTTGNACAPSLTIDRKLFVQDFQGTSPWTVGGTVTANQGGAPWSVSASGNFGVTQQTSPWVVSASGNFGVTQQTSPWVDSVTTWGGGTLGAMANYGTSPGAVLVPGVNAFITNTPAVTLTSTTITGTVAVTQSTSPWVDNVSQFGGTNISTGTGAGGAGIPRVTISNDSSLAANQSVNINQVGAVAVVAQTKGTQATNAIPTQDFKDSGRNRVSFTADRVTPAASDTLVTFTKNVGGTSTASQTTYTVTSGKTFRIQAVYFSVVTSTTTVISARLALRENTGGTCTASSAPVAMMEAAGVTAVANEGVSGTNMAIPDGWEFPAADSICFSAIGSTSTGTMTITIMGYEY